MKPGIPWSVKGIEPDVREAAKQAARRSGMTLGEWLNSTILDSADGAQEAARDSRPLSVAAPRMSRQQDETALRLEDIAEQLSRLSRRDSDTAPRYGVAEERGSENIQALHKILSRVESNERQTVEAFTAVNERLSVMGRQMTQAIKPRGETRPEESPGYMALEKAVRNIVEHMEASEKRTRDNFKSMHERFAGMSNKAANAGQDQILRQAPAFSQLETRLSDLAKRVDRSESGSSQNTLPDLLKNELTELANRIDTVRDTAEQLAMRAQTQAVQSSQQELRAIEQRIVGLVKEAQNSLSGNAAGPAEMQRLRVEIERLNGRIDEAHSAQASGGDVMALRSAVEQLSTRVAQGPDMRPLAEMDRRILEITQRLEQNQAQTRSLPQFGELERRIAELDHKLNDAVTGRGSAAANEIEDRLGEISNRVERTEQQLTSLETIERAVNQLFDSMEQQRKWTEEVADGAANRMAQHILAQGPQKISLSGEPEIHALQQGLLAVRAAAETADNRNQETLEAVHETLEQIVSKLAELETAAIGQRVAEAAGSAAFVDQNDAGSSPATVFGAEPVQWQQQTDETLAADPFMETPALNNPLHDPMLADPAPVNSFNPFETGAQGFSPAATVGAEIGGSDDFIAAARRAAQASVQQKSLLSGLSPSAAKLSEEGSKKLLSLSMFKKKDKTKGKSTLAAGAAPSFDGPSALGEIKPPPGFKAPANNNDTKKRKLLLMGLVLLAAVSAFTFNMMGHAKKTKGPVAPAAIEQTMPQPESSTVVPEASTNPEAPAVGKAQPPQPKPAELDSFLVDPSADPLLTTGSLPADNQEQSIASLIAADGGNATNLPPEEVGTLQLREAAALGSPEAQFVIGTRYLNGENGLQQDLAKAAYWYGKSAAQGLAPAQYRLGTLYERGKGVARDLDAALGWYERAAGLGNVKAMHNAAVLASGSESRAPDYKRAFKWFSLGATHGLKDSQFNLAVLLERGLGTKANPTEALFWYSLAAQQLDADADRRAATLAKTLSAADLKITKDRLGNWKSDIAPDSANVVAVTQPAWQAGSTPAG